MADPAQGERTRRVVAQLSALRAQREAYQPKQPKLQFPSDSELTEIARLVKLDDSHYGQFCSNVDGIIYDAHALHVVYGRAGTGGAVPTKLRDVLKPASDLTEALQTLLGTKIGAEIACDLLDLALASRATETRELLVSDYLEVVIDLLDAAEDAEREAKLTYKRRGRRPGSGSNIAFNDVIQRLFTTAWMHGTDWTNYKRADGTWTGTLLAALQILRPYLPAPGFFPENIDLGRAIHHIRQQLRKHGSKNPGQSG